MFTLLASILLLAPAGEVFSGPQKGEKTPGFKVLDLSGPAAGKEVDYIAEWNGAPTLVCFIHELTRPAAQLLRPLDAYGQRNREALRTLFVSLSEDVNQGERNLPRSIKALDMKCPVGISLDGKEGPGAWGLNKTVCLTIVLARGNQVVENWAIISPNETDFPKIREALDRLLAPALDTPEAVRAEILRLRAELGEVKAELEALKRGQSGAQPAMRDQPQRRRAREAAAQAGKDGESEKRSIPGKAPEDPKLNGFVRGLIRLEAAPSDIDSLLKEIEAHVGESADLRKQTVDAIILVDHLGYGTDYSKSSRKKLLEKYRQ